MWIDIFLWSYFALKFTALIWLIHYCQGTEKRIAKEMEKKGITFLL